MNGLGLTCVRAPKGGAAVIFVHGFLSSGETCWRSSNGAYWPQLLANETDSEMGTLGIYVFSYSTTVAGGTYSISDAVDALWAHLGFEHLRNLGQLIFVCHSMGGILARQLLVTRALELVEAKTQIGLFLVASPSLGSNYASLLSMVARALGNVQAEALRFDADNVWLNDLDKNFINLKESGRMAIHGQELVEDQFVLRPLPWAKAVVPPFTGARYFGHSLKIAGSDHFTIAKPADKSAVQHQSLIAFIKDFLRRSNGQQAAQQEMGAWLWLRLDSANARERKAFRETYVTIGRDPESCFVIDDRKVSWQHGVISVERGQVVYRHLSLTNPTIVQGRGRQIELKNSQEAVLVNQDRIVIGPATLVVEFTVGADARYSPTDKADGG